MRPQFYTLGAESALVHELVALEWPRVIPIFVSALFLAILASDHIVYSDIYNYLIDVPSHKGVRNHA